jgi:replicative DNA helicase
MTENLTTPTAAPFFDHELEQAFLGALLVDDTVYDDIAHLRPDHFYTPVHGRIYELIKKQKDAGKTITPHQVAQYFATDPDLSEAGGGAYIHDLARNVITTKNAKAHAELIHGLHLRRAVKNLGGNLIDLADNPDIEASPTQLLARAEKFIYEAGEIGAEDTIRHISECTTRTIEKLGKPEIGIRTGIPKLDAMIRGFKPGELYIIAGRPGMGKTALGLTFALNASLAGHKTLFDSLEMPQEQLTQRLLSRLSGECVHSGDPYDADKVDAARRQLDPLPLHVDDKSGLTITEIASRARRHKRRHGLDILFIDYLGLIEAEDRRANKVHQIEEVTKGAKRLAKELGIPVVLLCQLSRALEQRDNRRPNLGDLRDSGAIEQDADVVIFIYREEYYANQDADQAGQARRPRGRVREAEQLADIDALQGRAELIVAKARQNRLGTVYVTFDGERQVFHD